jgi:peptidoglycan/LPS O-acetylase OafA/YrhL
MGESASSAPRVGYNDALDGLRGVAIVSVFLHHTLLPGNVLGVHQFFVQSGFLITLLLLRERRERGAIDLKRFWARRFVRLMPAYYATIAVVFVAENLLFPKFARKFDFGGATLASLLLYVFNERMALTGINGGPLTHLWSLSLEEQFYAVWPPLLALLLARGVSRKKIGIGLAVAIVVIGALMIATGPPESDSIRSTAVFATQLRADGPLMGALAALAFDANVFRPRARHGAWAAAALFVLEIASQFDRDIDLMASVPICVLGAVVVLSAFDAAPSRFYRVMRSRVMIWIGKRAYSIFLVHFPIVLLLATLTARLEATIALRAITTLIAALLTLLLTLPAYRWLELPALRLKQRFRALPRRAPSPDAVPAA